MNKNITEQIVNFAHENGIEMIGFSRYYIDNDLKDRHQKKFDQGYNIPFNYDPKIVSNPKYLLESVESIISIALPYYQTCEQLENIKNDCVYFSASSWGRDYHQVLDEKLEQLIEFIKTFEPNFEYVKCVDTQPIDDRFWAYKSGIGFFGKNGLIINPKYGSYIFIGNLLTNLDLTPSQPLKNRCGDCRKCLDNCPTKALKEDGIDSSKCLSYLTQKKGELTQEEKEHFNSCIYGCDKCLQACPYNAKIRNGYHEFKPTGIEFIKVTELDKMTNRDFKKKYGHLAGSWRGKKIVERNIKIYQEKIDNKSSM